MSKLNATSCSSKLVKGWGSGRVPLLKYRDMSDFITKRPVTDVGSCASSAVSKRLKTKSSPKASPSTAAAKAKVQVPEESF